MKHFGLFEGIGGFSLAARLMGWETIGFNEINPFCQQVLRYHFPNAELTTDILKTDFTPYAARIDILTGGFPCQPYSYAGNQEGNRDPRHLWPEMLRAIREIKPRWVVAENVRGLITWAAGVVFNQVQTDLENEGYHVFPVLLPACGINAPHKRERIWLIAYTEPAGRGQSDEKITDGSPKQLNGCSFQQVNSNPDNDRLQGGRGPEGSTPAKGQTFQPGVVDSGYPWQNFPLEPPVCSGNDGISGKLDGITFSKWRNESIKGYGNAIVPGVALQIFKAIQEYEKLYI